MACSNDKLSCGPAVGTGAFELVLVLVVSSAAIFPSDIGLLFSLLSDTD